MTRHSLLTVALLFAGHCRVQAKVPTHPWSFPSAFVIPTASPSMTPARRSRPLTRRRVALSQHAEEEDAGFFVRASQQAAQERMRRLRDGTETLAISLSSSPPDIAIAEDVPTPTGGSDVEITEGAAAIATETGGHGDAGNTLPPPTPEVKVPTSNATSPPNYPFQRKLLETRFLMDQRETVANADKSPEADTVDDSLSSSPPDTAEDVPVGGNQVEITQGEAAIATEEEGRGDEGDQATPATEKTSPPNYHFQRQLLEARFLMDERATLANADKVPEVGSDKQEEHTTTTVTTQSSSVATKEADVAHPPLDSEKENTPMEPQTTTNSRLSSDGKKIFEPSPASLEVKEETVNEGLVVLTRAYLALALILDKKG